MANVECKITVNGSEFTLDPFLVVGGKAEEGQEGRSGVTFVTCKPPPSIEETTVLMISLFDLTVRFYRDLLVKPYAACFNQTLADASHVFEGLPDQEGLQLALDVAKKDFEEKKGLLGIALNSLETARRAFQIFVEGHTALGPMHTLDSADLMQRQEKQRKEGERNDTAK